MAVTELIPRRLFRIFQVVSAAPQKLQERVRFALARNVTFWLLNKNSTGAPTVTVNVSAVRPEAPAGVPVAAADKVAFGAAIVQAGDGLQRAERGDAAGSIVPQDLEIEADHTGAASTVDFEVWAELED